MTSYDVGHPIRKDQSRRRPQTVCREERAKSMCKRLHTVLKESIFERKNWKWRRFAMTSFDL